MLDFDGDVESAFLCSFEISYSDVFGNHLKHELIENGKDVMVTNENREVLKLFPLLFEFKEIVLWHSVDGKTLGCREIHWSRHSMNACKMHLVVVAYLTWVKRVFFCIFSPEIRWALCWLYSQWIYWGTGNFIVWDFRQKATSPKQKR